MKKKEKVTEKLNVKKATVAEKRKKTKDFTSKTSKPLTYKSKRLSIITIVILAIIAIVLLIGIFLGCRYLWYTIRYKEYKDKMATYGLAELYNNKKATSSEYVTNSEMIKVIVGSIKNEKNEGNITYLDNKEYTNQVWVQYATTTGINAKVNKDNEKEKATVIDSVITAVGAVDGVINPKIEQAKLDMDEKKLSEYTEVQREKIAEAVTLGLLKNKASDLSKSKITKGELNKIVVTLVEKYTTMYYGTKSTNKNGETVKVDVSLVTEDSKKPSNYEEYPYIIDAIPNEVYEMKKIIKYEPGYVSPKETYKTMSSVYEETDSVISYYLSVILNVDYNTITTADFYNRIKNIVTYSIKEDDVKDYVKYVKDNKIKLEGSSKQFLPIIYFDGHQYVVRTNITFKVTSSNTDKNLLFGDQNKNIKYDGKEFNIYVDLPMGQTINSNTLVAYITCIANHIVSDNPKIIVGE